MEYTYKGKLPTNRANLKSTKYNNKYIQCHKKYNDYKDHHKPLRALFYKILKEKYADLALKHFKKEAGLWKKI